MTRKEKVVYVERYIKYSGENFQVTNFNRPITPIGLDYIYMWPPS